MDMSKQIGRSQRRDAWADQTTHARSRTRSLTRPAEPTTAAAQAADASATATRALPTAAAATRTMRHSGAPDPSMSTSRRLRAAMAMSDRTGGGGGSALGPAPPAQAASSARDQSLSDFAATSAAAAAAEAQQLLGVGLGAWDSEGATTGASSRVVSGANSPRMQPMHVRSLDQPSAPSHDHGDGSLHASFLHHSHRAMEANDDDPQPPPLPPHADLATSFYSSTHAAPQQSATAGSASASSGSLVAAGSARIADLDPSEKGKIGSLLREVVAAQRARSLAEQQADQLEARVQALQRQSSLSEQEAAELRQQCQKGLEVIANYQRRLQATTATAAHDHGAQLPTAIAASGAVAPGPPTSENATISRLHELSERARAAASISPHLHPSSSGGSALARSSLTHDLATPRYPHTMPSVPFRYVPSASAAALSPLQLQFSSQATGQSAAGPPSGAPHSTRHHFDAPATSFTEQARSSSATAIPRPFSLETQPLVPVPAPAAPVPAPAEEPYVSSTLVRIHRDYATALEQAERSVRSLSNSPTNTTRRRLDLSSANVSAAPSPRSSRTSSPHRAVGHVSSTATAAASTSHHGASFIVSTGSASSRSSSLSPARRPVTLLSASTSPGLPPALVALPPALSGVTRAMLSSSPENIERRARQLAQEMFDKRMEEEARRTREANDREQQCGSGGSSDHHDRSERPAQQFEDESKSSLAPLQSAATRPTAPRSLSSFFHSHPLTSQLSPLKKQSQSQRQQQQQQQQQQPQRSNETRQDHGPELNKDAAPGANGAAPQSELAANLLNKSVRLAQAYAEERRARTGGNHLASSVRFARSAIAEEEEEEEEEPSSLVSSSLGRSRARAARDRSSSPPAAPAPSVPDSPFSAFLPPAEVALLTPTSRKIHRLLAIQNPAAAAAQRAAAEEAARRAEEERAFREKEAQKMAEAAAKLEARRRDIEAAEAMLQTQRVAASAAAVSSAATAATKRASVTRAVLPPNSVAPAQPQQQREQQSSLLPPPFPAAPAARARTPVETYMPPPFSFRPSSRASLARDRAAAAEADEQEQEEKHNDAMQTQQQAEAAQPHRQSPHHDDLHSPHSLHGGSSTLTSPALSTVASNRSHMSTPGSVAMEHPNAHTSFVSPFPNRSSLASRSAHSTGTGKSRRATSVREDAHADADEDADADADADAEVWDVFHLRSPTNLQQREVEQRQSKQQQPLPPPPQRPTLNGTSNVAAPPVSSHGHHSAPISLAQRRDTYARNFANDMLQASSTVKQQQQQQAAATRPRQEASLPISSPLRIIRHPKQPAASSLAGGAAGTGTSAPHRRSPSQSPSRVQSRMESLHMQQLERELDHLMPQVLEKLTHARTPQQQPVQQPAHRTAQAAGHQRHDDSRPHDRFGEDRNGSSGGGNGAPLHARPPVHTDPALNSSRDRRIARLQRDADVRQYAAQQLADLEQRRREEQAQAQAQAQAQERAHRDRQAFSNLQQQHVQPRAYAHSNDVGFAGAAEAGRKDLAHGHTDFDFDSSLLDVIDQIDQD